MDQVTEFSRPFRVDTIGDTPRQVFVEAGAAERAALAKRFELASLDHLEADASLFRRGGEVHAQGRLRARLVQHCVATFVELPAEVDAPFRLIFRSELPGEVSDAGLELDEGECDVVFYEGSAIDIGEAVAESLALAIDPYPRTPGADAALKEMGVMSEAEAGPFAALAALRK